MSVDTSLVHGTFSSSLRNRSVWKVLGQILTSTTKLQESELPGHDVDFHLVSNSQYLHVLLLTPSCLESRNEQETISRLKQFSKSISSDPQRNAVVFLLSEEPFSSASGKCKLDGLLTLQVLIVESLKTPIAIIPVPDSTRFLCCIESYMVNIIELPSLNPTLSDSVSLLSQTTKFGGSRGLSEHDTNVLSDLFPSLGAMSQAVRTQEGRAVLQDYFGDRIMGEIVGFWEDDGVCE